MDHHFAVRHPVRVAAIARFQMSMDDYLVEIGTRWKSSFHSSGRRRTRRATFARGCRASAERATEDYGRAEALAQDAEDAEDAAMAARMHWGTYFGPDRDRQEAAQTLASLELRAAMPFPSRPSRGHYCSRQARHLDRSWRARRRAERPHDRLTAAQRGDLAGPQPGISLGGAVIPPPSRETASRRSPETCPSSPTTRLRTWRSM